MTFITALALIALISGGIALCAYLPEGWDKYGGGRTV